MPTALRSTRPFSGSRQRIDSGTPSRRIRTWRAHYNFAATAFRAVQEDGCTPVASLTDAIDHLARSLQLDKGRLKRLKEDPDFAEFRHTARYFALLGADTHSTAGLVALLPKLKLSAPSRADSGPAFRLQFHQGGAVDVFDHQWDDGVWSWVRRRGTWRVKRTVIDGGQAVSLELSAPGTATVPAMSSSGNVTVGPTELVLHDEQGTFATDGWTVCCC